MIFPIFGPTRWDNTGELGAFGSHQVREFKDRDWWPVKDHHRKKSSLKKKKVPFWDHQIERSYAVQLFHQPD